MWEMPADVRNIRGPAFRPSMDMPEFAPAIPAFRPSMDMPEFAPAIAAFRPSMDIKKRAALLRPFEVSAESEFVSCRPGSG
jgi:hypothetical protein